MKPKNPAPLKSLPQKFLPNAEALQTLQAIKTGEVDAFVISGQDGDKVFTLESADYPYRMFLEEMEQGTLTITQDGSILYSNKSACRLLEQEEQNLMGLNIFLFINPADKPVFENLLSGSSRKKSVEVFFKTGSREFPVHVSCRPLAIGQVKCLCLVLTDLEEKKYRSIVDVQTEMIIRWKQGYFLTFANMAFCRYFHKRRREVTGKNFLSWLPQDQAASFMKSMEQAIESREPVEWECRLGIDRKSYRWSRWIHQVLRDERGNILEFQSSGTDITERRRHQERLAENEERLRKMVETALIGIYFANTSARILDCNNAFLSMTGFSRKDIEKGVKISQITPPEYEEIEKEIMRELSKTDSVGAHEKEIIHKDGHRISVLVSCSRFSDQMETVFFVQDISMQKKIQKRLQESESQYRSLTENLPAVFMRFDRSQKIVYISPSVKEAIGLSPEIFLGKTNEEVGHAPTALAESWRTMIDEVFQTGEKRSLEFDIPADWGIKTFYLRLAPEYGSRGQVKHVLGISTDVTESRRNIKLLEEARENLKIQVRERTKDLLRMNEVLEKIFSVENFLIAYLDSRFNYIRVNEAYAKAVGVDAEFFVHKHHFLLFPSPEQEEIFQDVIKHKETYRAFGQSMPFLESPALGHAYWDWTLQPVKASSGVVEGLVLVLINVTERKKAELKLLAAQQELDEAKHLSDIGMLASTVAHELRNPLAAINVAASNIKRKARRSRSFDPQIKTIEKKTAESDHIINNLLFYSRIKAAQREKMELSSVLDECIEVSQAGFQRSVQVVKNYQVLQGLEIEADPVQMRELFSNILHNAYDAMDGRSGRLEIEGAREVSFVCVTIKDNGVGISPEHLRDVGRPFFTTKAKGTGLGLSVCNQIVSLHKGRLAIESEPGKGTKVILQLPVKMEDKAYAGSLFGALQVNQ